MIGEHDLIFFDTDYENYAGIFTCQSVVVGHRRSASIISRTPLLSSRLIAKVPNQSSSFFYLNSKPTFWLVKARAKLMSQDIDLDRMKRIDQHPCSYLPSIVGTINLNNSFTQITDFGP